MRLGLVSSDGLKLVFIFGTGETLCGDRMTEGGFGGIHACLGQVDFLVPLLCDF